jgi:hypothetical protein
LVTRDELENGRLQVLRTTEERMDRFGGDGARAANVSTFDGDRTAPGDATGKLIATTLAIKAGFTRACAAWA